jgi:LuxR family transcriptional activator of conjugal transfer of Ti plasmids
MFMRDQREGDNAPVRLTPIQAVCLRWAAEARTMKEAAMIEGISVPDVAFHLENARRALGAVSLAQAIATATRLQLI